MSAETIELRHFIDGRWTGASSDEHRPKPSDLSERFATLPARGLEALNQAVEFYTQMRTVYATG